MKPLTKLGLLAMGLLIVSCQNYIMYHSYQHIPRSGWDKSDTLSFHLAVNDSLVNDSLPNSYSIELIVRNRTDYKYHGLRVWIEHNFPDTTVWKTDSIQVELADKDGKWIGKGLSGLYENTLIIDTATISKPRNYRFKISSMMNDSILTGLNDIGIIATKKE